MFLCRQITFVGEGAVDLGGPRREFFRLLACEAAESPYFCGGTLGKFFACNVPAVRVSVKYLNTSLYTVLINPHSFVCLLVFWQRSEYQILGQFTAVCAIQGGSGFPFFAPEVYNYLTTGQYTDLQMPDDVIPDPEIRNLVFQVGCFCTYCILKAPRINLKF